MTGTVGRQCRMSNLNVEDFVRPSAQITLSKRAFLHRDSHSVAHLVLPLVRFRLDRIQTFTHHMFVVDVLFHRCHAYAAMISVIVRMQHIVQYV